MIQLRDYQTEAVQSIFGFFESRDPGNCCVSMATGSGKSVVIAAFIKEVLRNWPSERVMVLTHSKELVQQDFDKLSALGVSSGVYSAGLNKRNIEHVTVGAIQSLHRRAHECGDVSLILVDEAHMLSRKSESMYGRFFEDLRRFCPHFRVVGFTASPWRLDSGSIVGSSGHIFQKICYNIGIGELIKMGFLCNLVTAPTKNRIDTSSVAKRGGEYIAGNLEKFVDKEILTKAALDEVDRVCSDRKSILFFCCGIDHAKHVSTAFEARGNSCAVIIGDTPSKERSDNIQKFKERKIRALISVGVLSVGVDLPCADALVCLRPTLSAGLWLQLCGRVARTYPGKENAMIVDMTGNTALHGPVDLIEVSEKGEPKTSPQKICENCGALIPFKQKKCDECGWYPTKICKKCKAPNDIDAEECADCGHPFGVPREPKHNLEATTAQILSDGRPTIKVVNAWDFKRHFKEGKPDSMRVRYWCGLEHFDQYLCLEHGGPATTNARLWWRSKGSGEPPADTTEALERVGELFMPEKICVKREGAYWKIVS